MFIEGNVRFDLNRTGAVDQAAPFPSVPVALQDVNSGMYIGAITRTDGTFHFDDVPPGDYAVIVYWSCPVAVPSPASFNSAVQGDSIVSVTPPVTALAPPPANATHLDFLSQSTYLVSVNSADISGINFILGPVRYTPINITSSGVTIIPGNIMECADNGTMGSFPQGSEINRGATPSPPYEGLVPDFAYVMPDPAEYVPAGDEYGIQNVMTNNRSNGLGSWWRIADHTTGNETGRFMIINGDMPGTSFFRTTVDVKPDTFYIFLGWVLNIYRSTAYAPPKFGLRISDEDGVIHYASLGEIVPVTFDMPAWKQIGAVIHTHGYNKLTIEFISEALEDWGNDYCLDDVSLNEIIMPDPLEIVKEADKDCVLYDQEVTFTVTVSNPLDIKIENIRFTDELPPCLSFVAGSVVVDDVDFPTYDPAAGWTFDLDAHDETVIVFKAKAVCRPPSGVACNVAQLFYEYEVMEDSVPAEYKISSVPACVKIPQVYRDGNEVWVTPQYQGGDDK